MKKQILNITLLLILFSVYLYPGSVILKRNIFTAPQPKIETQTILKPPPAPPLDTLIEILGIIYFTEAEEDSFVIIKNKRTNTEDMYKVGDNVGQAKILKIEIDRVLFEYDNKTIFLNIESKSFEAPPVSILRKTPSEIQQQKTETSSSGEIIKNVDFNKIITSLESDRSLIEKVNIIPNISNGKIEGYRVSNLPEGSIPYQYGLRNGDIIKSVNGIIIDSIGTAFRVYNQIKNSDTGTVTVEIIRDGQILKYTYQLNR